MRPNVILIICDTLRKDIIDMYGGAARMPNMKRLAKDSMVYDNCVAPSPWTFPSHVSLFTGMYPSEHGVHETDKIKVEQLTEVHKDLDVERLPEYMQTLGYNTLGISNNLMVSRFTGFDRGFDNYFNIEPSPWSRSDIATEARDIGGSPFQVVSQLVKTGKLGRLPVYAKEFMNIRDMASAVNYPLNKGAELTNNILMNANLNPEFFLFVNFWEMHEPYKGFSEKEMLDNLTGIKPMSNGKVQYLKSQYVLEAEYLDEQLGILLSMLRMRGLYDDTMIIITSDHGQAFNEHGFMYHGNYLYDEIVRVPLIVKYPYSKKFKKRNGYQSLVNIQAMIKSIVDGGDDAELTTEMVFAEAFGNTENIPKSHQHRMEYIRKKYEKVRRSIYMNGYKLTVNGTDSKLEEFVKGDDELQVHDKKHRSERGKLERAMTRFNRDKDFSFPEENVRG